MITADILTNSPFTFEDPALGHGVVNELTIVADQHHGALITVNQLFQQFQRFDIQIVGRFIEDQQVAWLQEQARQQKTVALTA